MAALPVSNPTSAIIRELVGLDLVVSPWLHEGAAAELVRALKYQRSTAAVSVLADAVAAVAPVADFVTWVPAARQHRRQRGFDQSELLARAVARRMGLPAIAVLRRIDRAPQTERDLRGRLAGPMLSARRRRLLMSRTMLLIDDVCTTGATLRAAAAAWRQVGGARVVAATATSSV